MARKGILRPVPRKVGYCHRYYRMWLSRCWTSISPTRRVGRAVMIHNGGNAAVMVYLTTGWCDTRTTGGLAISGTREHAEILCEQAAEVLSTVGLRLSPDKTLITHIALLTELSTA